MEERGITSLSSVHFYLTGVSMFSCLWPNFVVGMISLLLHYYLLPVGLMRAVYCDTIFRKTHAAPLLSSYFHFYPITSQTVRGYCDRQSDLLLTYSSFCVVNCMLNEWSDTLTLKVSSHRNDLILLNWNMPTPLLGSGSSRLDFACSFSSSPLIAATLLKTPRAECEFRSGRTRLAVDEARSGGQNGQKCTKTPHRM